MKTILALLMAASSSLAQNTNLFVYNGKTCSGADLEREKCPIVFGKAVRAMPQGLLVFTYDDHGTSVRTRIEGGITILLTGSNPMADGEEVFAFAAKSGLFSYTNAGNQVSTLRVYETLKRPSPKEVSLYEKEAKEKSSKLVESRVDAEAKRKAEMTAENERNAKYWKEKMEKEEAERALRAKLFLEDRNAKQAALDAKVSATYRVRADAGDADAQYELALRYMIGKGVAKDEASGAKLLEQAAKQGHKKAAEKLKTLSEFATKAQPAGKAK